MAPNRVTIPTRAMMLRRQRYIRTKSRQLLAHAQLAPPPENAPANVENEPFQDPQDVENEPFQDPQDVENELFQDPQDVENEPFQDPQDVENEQFQDPQDVDPQDNQGSEPSSTSSSDDEDDNTTAGLGAEFNRIYHEQRITRETMVEIIAAVNAFEGKTIIRLPRYPVALPEYLTIQERKADQKQKKTKLMRAQEKKFLITADSQLYIGIGRALEFLFTEKEKNYKACPIIKLSFNTDGLPTAKSSNAEIWPILMSTNIEPTLVHVISVFFGHTKPKPRDIFTAAFVVELGYLLKNGMTIMDNEGNAIYHSHVEMGFVVCDLPALALAKAIKGPTGYSSCSKCTVLGVNDKRRMSFIPAIHNAMFEAEQLRLASLPLVPNDQQQQVVVLIYLNKIKTVNYFSGITGVFLFAIPEISPK